MLKERKKYLRDNVLKKPDYPLQSPIAFKVKRKYPHIHDHISSKDIATNGLAKIFSIISMDWKKLQPLNER